MVVVAEMPHTVDIKPLAMRSIADWWNGFNLALGTWYLVYICGQISSISCLPSVLRCLTFYLDKMDRIG
jgi:hypothetical protein